MHPKIKGHQKMLLLENFFLEFGLQMIQNKKNHNSISTLNITGRHKRTNRKMDGFSMVKLCCYGACKQTKKKQHQMNGHNLFCL